jgi:flagellar hook-basal body complex protein FliE
MNDMGINKISQGLLQKYESTTTEKTKGFGEIVKSELKRVGELENEADQSIVGLLQGKADIHETMIALQKTDISMRMFLTVRNKAIEAYREVMRMQF